VSILKNVRISWWENKNKAKQIKSRKWLFMKRQIVRLNIKIICLLGAVWGRVAIP
jgi:hypothetical protein